ncbi:hypothetical protein NT6N_22340 [Oceaniferula spumae]|uniref:GmrSD restriction endonucleases N-terminal domain-containing protein n=1 Tax=Oceaniferula spumae TaxID=2979115 RepID=A0AAT9FMG2_9BACT
MSENTQETRSISDLVKLIEDGKLLLPEFQRDFKWPIDKSLTLFDSINRNLFIGSLILARPKFDLACKGFDLRERGSKKHKPKPKLVQRDDFETKDIYTLLDGQQRTTAIYRALLGKDEIYYIFEDFDTLCSAEYYDKASKRKKVGLENYISGVDSRQPKDEILFIKVSDLYNSIDYREQRFIDEYIEPQLDEYTINDDQKEVAREFASAMFSDFKTDIIKKEKLLSVQLLNMPLKKFCLFFERSNSMGMILSFVDIINAKVYIDFKLSAEVGKAKSRQYFYDGLVDPIVRYINYLENGDVTRTSILENLTGADFNKHWATCVKDICYIQCWLEDNDWLFRVKEIPYRTMLLPLLHFYQKLPNKEFSQASSEQMDQLKYWFYASLMDNRYGGGGHGSTNIVIKKDCEALRLLAEGKNISKDYWGRIRILSDFDSYKKTDNAKSASFMGLTYYLWHKKKFLNFENNATISVNNKVDVHHIFPDNYLKKKFGVNSDEYDFSDSVLNKVRINKISNIKIGDRSPKTYLSEIKKSNADIETSLKSHCINCANDLISGNLDDDYLAFIQKRYDELEVHIQKIKKAGQKLSDGKYKKIWGSS